MDEACECKRLRYVELAAESEQNGQKSRVSPVEVGCSGFIGKSTTRLLKDMGIRGQAQCQALKALSGAAERARQWLWIKRRGNIWLQNNTKSS